MNKTEIILQRFMGFCGFSTQNQVCELLGFSKSFLSQTIMRDSYKTIINKIIDNNIKISIDALLEPEDNISHSLYYLYSNSQNQEFVDKINTLYFENSNIDNLLLMFDVFFKGESKGIKALVNYFSGNSVRALRVFYFFIVFLKRKTFKLSANTSLKKQFLDELENFRLTKKDSAKFLFTFREKDKNNLKEFLEKEINDQTILQIINNFDKVLEIIEKNMDEFDKVIIKLTK